MSTALVLGSGGPLGWVFHLGVVEALRERYGVDPAAFDRLIGTSAGAAIAGAVASGATTAETLAALTTGPSEDDMATMRGVRDDVRSTPWRLLRPLAPGLAPSLALRRPVTALAGVLPRGVFPTGPLRSVIDRPVDAWPPNLWITAVRVDDGALVVFGRDEIDGHVDLADAIEASSAVPVMFQPKRIGDQHYIDGGVESATNVGLLADAGFDRIIVSSISARQGRRPGRLRARHQLRGEIAAVEAGGASVAVVTPSEEFAVLAGGFPRGNGDRAPEIVDAARRLATAQLETAGLRFD
ncbi:MAG: patatin-like phospholipase family protein [Actinomycetota bacterium]